MNNISTRLLLRLLLFTLSIFSITLFLQFNKWELTQYVLNAIANTKQLILCTQYTGSHTDKRRFVTFTPTGHLGNQMFLYASVLGIAARNNRTPFVRQEENCLVCNAFNLTYAQRQLNSVVKRCAYFEESGWGKYDARFECLPKDDISIGVYLQSFKYFNEHYIQIKKEFQFIQSIDTAAHRLMSSALSNVSFSTRKIMNVTTVGIHVRRGDVADHEDKIQFGYLVPSANYFTKAMEYMRAAHEHVVFLVTSNDYTWARQNIVRDDVVFVEPATPEAHMATLSKCNHVIMSVGTFGWWAGFLSGGDVIYYSTPYKVGSGIYGGYSRGDFYPDNWVGIGD